MNTFPNTVKETLSSLISEMSGNPMLYVKNPGIDFTRERKLPFVTVINLLIHIGGNSIYKELLKSQGYDVNTATTSSFIQQRNKILPCAFEFLLHEFTASHADIKTYRGCRLFAADVPDLQIPTLTVLKYFRGCIFSCVNGNNLHIKNGGIHMKPSENIQTEHEKELVKLLMAECQSTGEIQPPH